MASSGAAKGQGIQRQDIQAAIAKAVELRALHAALVQGGAASPAAVARIPACASPALSRVSNQFSAEEYPVFTPSYGEEPLPRYIHIHHETQSLSENYEALTTVNKFSSSNEEQHLCSVNDNESNSSYISHISNLQSALGTDILKSSRRTTSGECKLVTTSYKCKPSSMIRDSDSDQKSFKNVRMESDTEQKSFKSVRMESDSDQKSVKNVKITAPSTDSHLSLHLHTRSRGQIFSWLFPRGKKKPKSEMSPNTMEPEDMSQILKDWGVLSLESLKKELLEANENRDAAVAEVAEMRSSLGELKRKLIGLERYCEELKKALKQAVQGKDAQIHDRSNVSKRTKSIAAAKDSSMPVSHEVMVEGFLQIVSEARLSVKQFCKTLITQIDETDDDLMEKLNILLQPYQVTLSNGYTKGVLYHLEALMNQSLYLDFENCVFQKNGSPKFLDPQKDCMENFSAFVGLRNLSWNEVLRKGTKYYSEDFSKFCDQKMSCIVSILNWSRPWPEQLLQSFFVAAKCIWLVHLLAFSFSPPLVILRVDENRSLDPLYMEDILLDRQRSQAPARVKIMVMPGFYIQDRVLKCRVLCRYRTIA